MNSSERNRILDLAARISTAMVAGKGDDPVRIQEILSALPLSVAYFIAVIMHSYKTDDQLAACVAILQQLSRHFSEASEDHAFLAKVFQCGVAAKTPLLH